MVLQGSRSAVVLLVLSCTLLFVVGGCFALGGRPEDRGPHFSHEIHGEDKGLRCIQCHAGASTADRAGLPGPQLCAPCHDKFDADKPPERRLAAFFDENGRYVSPPATTLTPEIKFSHGNHASHAEMYAAAREAAERAERHVAILADLSGPKIRVGRFAGGGIDLADGAEVTVTVRPGVQGEPGLIPSEYEPLARDVKANDRILLDDGKLELRVIATHDTEIRCKVVHGGFLKDKKGMNLPGVSISTAGTAANRCR